LGTAAALVTQRIATRRAAFRTEVGIAANQTGVIVRHARRLEMLGRIQFPLSATAQELSFVSIGGCVPLNAHFPARSPQ